MWFLLLRSVSVALVADARRLSSLAFTPAPVPAHDAPVRVDDVAMSGVAYIDAMPEPEVDGGAAQGSSPASSIIKSTASLTCDHFTLPTRRLPKPAAFRRPTTASRLDNLIEGALRMVV